MDGFDGQELSAPVDWAAFERLCCDLWCSIWTDQNTQRNGRTGQPQHGVDVFGRRRGEPGYSGVQCRRKGDAPNSRKVSEAELRAEVAKAKKFTPRLTGEFVLAYTGPPDAKIQEVARRITQEHVAEGSFEVAVWSWHQIQERLGSHPEVFAKHYADLVALVRTFDQRTRPELVPAPEAVAQLPPSAIGAGSTVITEPSGLLALLESEHRAEVQSIRGLLKGKTSPMPGLTAARRSSVVRCGRYAS